MKEDKTDVKIRYTPEEFEKIKEKARKSGKSPNEYQKDTSKKARVIIEVK